MSEVKPGEEPWQAFCWRCSKTIEAWGQRKQMPRHIFCSPKCMREFFGQEEP